MALVLGWGSAIERPRCQENDRKIALFAREYNIRQDRLPSRNRDLPNAFESKPYKVHILRYVIANAKKACYACLHIMKVF
jgi:hypothetical protein